MTINQVTPTDFDEWLRLALALWPDYTPDELQPVLTAIAQSPKEAGFLVRDERRIAIGFMNLSLRHDYVPGATEKPVAYVEGIYVNATHQQQGIGRKLIERAQQWACDQGCNELASDVLIDNAGSAEFHAKVGFEEVDRVISFIKRWPAANGEPD